MLLAELKIRLTTDSESTDEQLSELSGLYDELADTIEDLCFAFKRDNPSVKIEIEH